MTGQHEDRAVLVLGADGCKGGSWVVAMIDGEGELSWHAAADTAALLAARPDVLLATTGYGMRRWFEAADAAGQGGELTEVLRASAILVRGPKARGSVRAAGLADAGMSEEETDAKFDSIVEFSEMGKFLNNEVRHYSSGIFMRLAFAVAIHTECDIFLMDEMLSVGDQPFKRKCMRKIMELKESGKTMVYVSHNPRQVLRVCNRGIVLEKGELVFEGPAEDAVKKLGYDLDEDEDE